MEMTQYTPLVTSVTSSLLLGLVLTPLAKKLGAAAGLVDIPGGRRSHAQPTPRSGGIAIFLAFNMGIYLICRLWTCQTRVLEYHQWHTAVFLGSVIVFATGILDDRFELRPATKMLGQMLAGLWVWFLGVRLGSLVGVPLPVWADLAGTLLLYFAGMNAYNLIDGMDGVAAGLGAVTGLGICGLNLLMGNLEMAAASLALSGACLGFLRYNFHRASIFLGDSGSMLIGFFLISLTLGSAARGTAAILVIVPMLALGVPLVDAALAVWRRSVRKAIGSTAKISEGDKDHLHHRLARRGLTQRRVAVSLYLLQASFFTIGLLWVFGQNYRLAIFTLTFFAGSYVLFRYLATLEMTDSGRWIVDGIRRPGRKRLFSSLLPGLDLSIYLLALYLSHFLLNRAVNLPPWPRFLREAAPLFVGTPIIMTWATGFYRPMWSRARAVDFFYLALVGVTSVLAAVSLSPFSRTHSLRDSLLFLVLYLALSQPTLIGLRVAPRLAQDLFHFHFRSCGSLPDLPTPRTLIYGAGYGYTLICRAESFEHSSRRRNYFLIGLIDDDPMLKGVKVHGHEVLGDLQALPNLVDKHRIQEVIVSTILSENNLKTLKDIAKEKNLKLYLSILKDKVIYDPALRDCPPGDSSR